MLGRRDTYIKFDGNGTDVGEDKALCLRPAFADVPMKLLEITRFCAEFIKANMPKDRDYVAMM